MHLQRANRRHNHRRIWGEARGAALDVKELLCAHIGAKARFGHNDLTRCECGAVGNDGVVAMRNVCKRSGMYECWTTFKCLQQVRLNRVTQERGHRASNFQVFSGDRFAVNRFGDHNAAKTRSKIGKIGCERKYSHNFTGNGDHRFGFTDDTVLTTTETDDRLTNRAITDVNDARPGDAAQVDVECVAVMQVIVEECRGEIMRGANRVHITGEVQVELLHRNHLAIAAARSAALDTEDWSEAWLSNRNGGAVANLVEALRESNGGGGLPFTEWRWTDRGDHDVLAACAALL